MSDQPEACQVASRAADEYVKASKAEDQYSEMVDKSVLLQLKEALNVFGTPESQRLRDDAHQKNLVMQKKQEACDKANWSR